MWTVGVPWAGLAGLLCSCKERSAKNVGIATLPHENLNLRLKIWCPPFKKKSGLSSRISEICSIIFYFSHQL